VGNIDMSRLRLERDQLWAEAAMVERTGIPLVLPEELWAVAAVEQNARLESDPFEDILAKITGAFLYFDAVRGESDKQSLPPGEYEWVSATDVLTIHLAIPRERLKTSLYRQVMPIMRRLGWTDVRPHMGGIRERGYVRARFAKC